MTHYEIATLKTVIFGAGKAAAGLEAWLGAGTGTLLGAFATDIGPLNEVFVLRGFDTLEAMMAERRRALRETKARQHWHWRLPAPSSGRASWAAASRSARWRRA